MFAKIKGATLSGIFPEIIEIEVGLSGGFPNFQIVGLPDETINEAKERISLALKNVSAKPPNKINARVIVNLAPADLKKEGPLLDLPIALAYLAASRQIKTLPKDYLFLGELGLDGSLRKIKGALPITLKAAKHFSAIILPEENLAEVSFVKEIKIYGFSHLQEVIDFIEERILKIPVEPKEFSFENQDLDLNFIVIDDYLLRGIILGVIGNHNFLLYGPPGTGKTIMAQNIVHLLPNLDYDSALEISAIYSALGLLQDNIIFRPQLRAPHHSASAVSILGGGKDARPGEVTLAHRGVLFFDELPEFRRDVLEGIREPLETGEITIARAKKTVKYPARFLFVGAYNPCPCGFYGDPEIECKCSISEINRYQKKISGPLLDRIDINLNVPRINSEKIFNLEKRNFEQIKGKIIEVREKIYQRYKNENFKNNSEIPAKKIKDYAKLTHQAEVFLKKAIDKHRLSLRGIHKILKLARTIADYNEKDIIDINEVGEALQYRVKEN
ncbi:MAG: Fis family transcriptional regulator [Candidatus Parcubacteria bacterium]|nr:MAG: Fis family transcriptional regulator [Candidatus Parcubacteria bacterium]